MPEMLVTFSLFLVVVSVTSGIFIASFRSQREILSFLNVQNNIRFTLETMSREMRTGTGFRIIRDGSPLTEGLGRGENDDILSFQSQEGQALQYRLSGGKLEKTIGGSFMPLTAENVSVESFKFFLTGAAANDGKQPHVTLYLRVRSSQGREPVDIAVETTVTQRELDN